VKDVLEWDPPKNVLDIRSFVGFAGYYRHFIQDFSKVAKSMTWLLEKVKKSSSGQRNVRRVLKSSEKG
jgi:hypothetical protein